MTGAALEPHPAAARGPLARLISNKLFRYGLAAIGPVGTAAAQFVLSLVLLHTVEPTLFGGFSFLLVMSQFSMGIWSALFCAPMPLLLNKGDKAQILATRRSLMAVNLAASVVAGAVFTTAGVLLGTPLVSSLLFGGYVGIMLLRWFGRAYAYAIGQQVRTTASDVIFSLALFAVVGSLAYFHSGSLELAYGGLLISALVGLLPFGAHYLRAQFVEVAPRDMGGYAAVWKAHSGWSLIGVLTTEATVNAHAYIVTVFAGAASFAPLAASALLMRPIQVATNALTEFERPQMARQVAKGEYKHALDAMTFFRIMLMVAWIGAIGLAVALYRFAPQILFPKAYDQTYLMLGTALWMGVAFIRLLRSPESVLLQAAGQFRPLAHASMISCGVSLAAVAALLVAFGPLWSIAGIFVGESVFAFWTWRQRRAWQRKPLADGEAVISTVETSA